VGSYSVEFTRNAAKEFKDLPAKDRARVHARISSLAGDPRPTGAEKLSLRERYRLRQGDYRILYTIEDALVRIVIVKIAHRRDVYRR